LKQHGRDLVDALVGALGRKDGGDQQFEGVLEIQGADRFVFLGQEGMIFLIRSAAGASFQFFVL